MGHNGGFGVATADMPAREGHRLQEFSTPMASHKFASFQSCRGGGDLAVSKSIENFGHVLNSTNGSGLNLLGPATSEPAAKIQASMLNQICRADGFPLQHDDPNQTLLNLKQQLIQLTHQTGMPLPSNNPTGQYQNQVDNIRPVQAHEAAGRTNIGDGRAALKVSSRLEQAESNHQMNHSQIDDVDNIVDEADRAEVENTYF